MIIKGGDLLRCNILSNQPFVSKSELPDFREFQEKTCFLIEILYRLDRDIVPTILENLLRHI